MRSFRTFLASLALLAGVVGCAGETAEVAEVAEVAASSGLSSCYVAEATLEEALERPSPLKATVFSVGGHEGTLCYSAPSARGRVVAGELIPFLEPWRLGANEATAFHLTGPAQIGGVDLDAGSYSLYAVAGETEWRFYLNSSFARWGIPINDAVRATDVGSFTVPVEATEAMVETLTFSFVPSEDGTMGDMVVEWENTRVKFHLHPAS